MNILKDNSQTNPLTRDVEEFSKCIMLWEVAIIILGYISIAHDGIYAMIQFN